MDPEAHLAAVDHELAALIAAVGSGPGDAPVPTCPGWVVTDLVDHVVRMASVWTAAFQVAVDVPPSDVEPAVGAADPVGRLQRIADELLPLVRAVPPDGTVATWYPPEQTAAFWRRRMAHELAIHRVDAQAARGTVEPIAGDLAVDGIDEALFLAQVGGPALTPAPGGAGETVHLHGTDHDDAEWLVTLGADGLTFERVHAKGDLAVRGAVSDLELLLYQRPVLGELTRFGDDGALAALHRVFTLA